MRDAGGGQDWHIVGPHGYGGVAGVPVLVDEDVFGGWRVGWFDSRSKGPGCACTGSVDGFVEVGIE